MSQTNHHIQFGDFLARNREQNRFRAVGYVTARYLVGSLPMPKYLTLIHVTNEGMRDQREFMVELASSRVIIQDFNDLHLMSNGKFEMAYAYIHVRADCVRSLRIPHTLLQETAQLVPTRIAEE